MPAVTTQEDVRRHNLSALLRLLHLSGPLTRAELTARMGLNRSTIRGLVGDLASAGLVEEGVPADRTGAGRPSLLVAPRADRVWVLALEVGTESVAAARVGLGGAVQQRAEVERALVGSDPAAVVATATALVRGMMAALSGRHVLAGVGVAVPGVVRHDDGLVHIAPNLGWQDVPFGRMLVEALALDAPVAIGNDADLGALAERGRGAAIGHDHVIYLAGDIGIGAGVIADGRPLTGAAGYGGEVGHMKVNPCGRRCRCGAVGCWETEAGEEALLRLAGRPPDEGRAGMREVLDRAAAGDPLCRAALAETGRWIGLGVANLVNVFNPEMVIFGGLMRDLFTPVHDVVRATIDEAALPAPARMVRLAVPRFARESALLGAAERAFEPLLVDPLGTCSVALTG